MARIINALMEVPDWCARWRRLIVDGSGISTVVRTAMLYYRIDDIGLPSVVGSASAPAKGALPARRLRYQSIVKTPVDYGRRGRCFAEIDRISRLPGAAGSMAAFALFNATVINAWMAGLSKSAAAASTM